ncbi:MFS transporter [Pendulispora albinea]|uniref:MFS transporter n=2 Tax=Pendulispora albinea TaxID=2741071 RepID=A0ABZ2LRT0_9BACT
MTSVQQSAVMPLLPRMRDALHVPLTTAAWAVTISLLCGAVATPLLGRLGDLYGRRRMLLVTLAALLAGSVLGALSTSLAILLVARALQGCSAALVPLAIGAVRDALPAQKAPVGISVVTATMGTGVGGGLVLSGLVSRWMPGYHAVFWVIAGLAALVLALTAQIVRDVNAPPGGSLDLPGAALLIMALTCALLAIGQGTKWGWGSPRTTLVFIAAALLFAIWVEVEKRCAAPLIAIPMLVHRGTVGASVAALALGFALFGGFALIPTFAQANRALGYGFDASVLEAGLCLLPTALLMLVMSPWTGRLVPVCGASTLVAVGALITALSDIWLMVSHDRIGDLLVASSLFGLGLGLGFAALGVMAVEHVPAEKTAVASAINSLSRLTGGSLAGAVTSAIFAADTIPQTTLPSERAYVISFGLIAAAAAACAIVTWVFRFRSLRVS